jgi:hypothetical protein
MEPWNRWRGARLGYECQHGRGASKEGGETYEQTAPQHRLLPRYGRYPVPPSPILAHVYPVPRDPITVVSFFFRDG